MIKIEDYDYHLPKEFIASEPAIPRDASRLFIYDIKSDRVSFDYFYNLDQYLPKNSFLVLNNTKVLPSRIVLRKLIGGRVVILFLVNEIVNNKNNIIRGLVDRRVKMNDKLFFDNKHFMTVIDQDEHLFTFRFDFSKEKLFQLFNKQGTMPIPLYIKNSPLTEAQLRIKYQTVFAKVQGSAAAPTASLHFTHSIFKQLDQKNIKKLFITLHVGLGTFAPITEKNLKMKKLHEEIIEVDQETFQCIRTLKREGKQLVAVGTTVVRTLESLDNKKKDEGIDATDLFIYPPYKFKMVDSLITNFHLPKSSLMMLAEAFLQNKHAKRHLVDLYQIAIKEKFRFYSFGDVMLIS
jgi:S-adenosylmethionine:tRNA ribosyltransferase-isomerase